MYAGNRVYFMFTRILIITFILTTRKRIKYVRSVVVIVVVTGFLVNSSTNSATRTTESSTRKSRDMTSAGDKSDPPVATRKSATHTGSHLSPPVTQ